MLRYSAFPLREKTKACNLPVYLLIYMHTLILFKIEKNVEVTKSSKLKIENVRTEIACVTSVNLLQHIRSGRPLLDGE